MARRRLSRLDSERRRQLLAAAAEEFASHGFRGASLARIGVGAGFSKAALYYYFEDKADVYAAVVEEAWAVLLPRDRFDLDALDAAGFWDELRRRYLAMLERSQREAWLPAAGKLIYDPAPPPGVGRLVEASFSRARRFLARLVQRGQELGVVRSDLPAGLLVGMVVALVQAADRWTVQHWSELDPEAIEPMAHRIFELLERIMRPEAAA